MLYFANISVNISPSNQEMQFFKFYMGRAVEKCQKMAFLDPYKGEIFKKQKWKHLDMENGVFKLWVATIRGCL